MELSEAKAIRREEKKRGLYAGALFPKGSIKNINEAIASLNK